MQDLNSDYRSEKLWAVAIVAIVAIIVLGISGGIVLYNLVNQDKWKAQEALRAHLEAEIRWELGSEVRAFLASDRIIITVKETDDAGE